MVVEQLDLFATSEPEEEEVRQSLPLTRQHRLMDWLKANFISGRYFTIEEIVEGVVDKNGMPYYKLNKNPYNHDKCAVLSSDVRAINWSITDRYHIIIKDSKGSCKLVESKAEFDEWKSKELLPLETKWKYLNNLSYKEARDGTCPIINLANNPIDLNNVKPVEVNAR